MLAVCTGLGLAEGVARIQSGGAFPHVNFYLPDEALGVRLEPGAHMRFQLRDNPAHDIVVNADGYRGADWPAPGREEVLVVGDSQVFGLGVEGEDTFSARLAAATGRTVLNGGVPTYGPDEYAAVVEEILSARSVSTVVLTINMSNDLFELSRPNRDRHAVWDGWAVRVETAPASVIDFPGRRWLMGRSHLVYAARRLMASGTPGLDADGAPSEGGWEDLVRSGAEIEAERTTRRAERTARKAELEGLGAAAREAGAVADQKLLEDAGGRGSGVELAWRAARGDPGDILRNDYAEESRDIAVTAHLIRKAGQHRAEAVARSRSPETKAAVASAAAADAAWLAASRSVPPAPQPAVIEPYLDRLQATVESEGAELVVVVLPLDVQVDPGEWAKYGAEPVDMTPSLVLNAEIVDAARARGLRALDARPALAAAEPGAFLDGDLHMTARGHGALAEALAGVLAEPAPPPAPRHGLPAGRTVVPPREAWFRTPEASVRGSTRARCETVRIDEWLRVACLREGGRVPSAVEPLSGALPDTHTLVTRDAATLVTPLEPGRALRVRFHWTGWHQDLTVDWDGGTPRMAFGPEAGTGRPAPETEAAELLCGCQAEVHGEMVCENHISGAPATPRELEQELLGGGFSWLETGDCEGTCTTMEGEASAACETVAAGDCAVLLGCMRGDPDAAGDCGPGAARMAGSRQCRPLCDDVSPCEVGVCQAWMGTGVCVVGGG